MKIVTAQQMRNIDRRTTETYGIPSIILMETAAREVFAVIRQRFPNAERLAIFCGGGQNGGDGLAVARLALLNGLSPELFLIGTVEQFRGDARTNLEICSRVRIPLNWISDKSTLSAAFSRASRCQLVVDAIFGTGLNRPAEGLHSDVIRGLNDFSIPILSVDIPSGLNASSPGVHEPVIRASLTVTFAQHKIATVFSPAAEHCGEIVVAGIGIPQTAIDDEQASLSLTTAADVFSVFTPRVHETHKGSYGHVGIIAGSEGRSGAAILAARGAVRGGAGLVTVLTDRETARIVDSFSVESMTFSIDPGKQEVREVSRRANEFSSLVIGPGLKDDEGSYEFVRTLIDEIDVPMVIDASAINALGDSLSTVNPRGRPRVMTPHPGELARVLGMSPAEINGNRVVAVRRAAEISKCVVVLKGHQTLVADPHGKVALNPTGNPGMASGGMGDVLSGLLGALIARESDLFLAAQAAVYLHGKAGDILRGLTSDTGLSAMDLAEQLPLAVARVREEVE